MSAQREVASQDEAMASRSEAMVIVLDGAPPPIEPAEARRLLRALMRRLAVTERSVAVVFGSDQRLRDLNRRYRHKDRPTDVLSFPAGEGDHLGDIAISSETARRNARAAGRSAALEARHLLIHGFLHLLDYDHETDDGEMVTMERCLRRELAPPAGGRA
jgi:probable rRNA maturation factor